MKPVYLLRNKKDQTLSGRGPYGSAQLYFCGRGSAQTECNKLNRGPRGDLKDNYEVVQYNVVETDGEPDATLAEWRVIGITLVGNVYGDKKGRFEDGSLIRTSRILRLDLEKGIAVTSNSVYNLGDEWTE